MRSSEFSLAAHRTYPGYAGVDFRLFLQSEDLLVYDVVVDEASIVSTDRAGSPAFFTTRPMPDMSRRCRSTR